MGYIHEMCGFVYYKINTLPLKLVYEGRPEDLDVEKIKGLFIENGYTFDIY